MHFTLLSAILSSMPVSRQWNWNAGSLRHDAWEMAGLLCVQENLMIAYIDMVNVVLDLKYIRLCWRHIAIIKLILLLSDGRNYKNKFHKKRRSLVWSTYFTKYHQPIVNNYCRFKKLHSKITFNLSLILIQMWQCQSIEKYGTF